MLDPDAVSWALEKRRQLMLLAVYQWDLMSMTSLWALGNSMSVEVMDGHGLEVTDATSYISSTS